jgi:hypothetical protein
MVAAFVLAAARPGSAAPFVFDVTVDLAAVPVEDVLVGGNAGNRIRFTADFPDIDDFLVTDTLHLNVSFANGAAIRLIDTGAPFQGDDERIVGRAVVALVFRGSDRHHVFQFTGVQGDLQVNPLITDDFDNILNLTNGDFAISGLRTGHRSHVQQSHLRSCGAHLRPPCRLRCGTLGRHHLGRGPERGRGPGTVDDGARRAGIRRAGASDTHARPGMRQR